MDRRLVAWARAVKSRQRRAGLRGPPVLWLFTDARRVADPLSAASRLPSGLAGVVFRHDGEPGRAALGRELARICRERRLMLVVAGDVRLARSLRAGVHLRAGAWPSPLRAGGRLVTSSAHSMAELRRAPRAGAAVIFLAPAFRTASHPDARGFGPIRWTRLARSVEGVAVCALGGVDGTTVRRLTRFCAGAGAIGALM
ncbi:MAG: thiamine phosphate synthase [Acetobacteraceae bacterium]|nr:thiamine phosphate synthase [Acetobacteraceae bacterium]